MFRLNIDTIYLKQAYYAAQTLEVIREIAKKVNRLFLAPICVYSSSLYTFMVSCIHSIIIFFSILPSVFSKVIGRQLPSREQSFLFAFQRTTIIISLQHSSRLPLRRQVVVALASSVATVFNTVLIALFRIPSSPTTLLIGSFHIVFFISFGVTIWLISKGKGRSQLLISCKST